MRSRHRKTVAFTVPSIVIVGLLAYLFLFGKLFPFSPVIVGFTDYDLPNMTVYVQEGVVYDDFHRFDTLTSVVEEFHQFTFLAKPELFIFRDSASYFQRTVTRARFFTYPNGRIMVSPWAIGEDEQGTISLDTYLRHELSHALLCQHMGILTALDYPQWLLEGIAVYSANQRGTSWYPDRDQTLELIKQGNFMPPLWFGTEKEDRVEIDWQYRAAFCYSEFACIVEYLIHIGGKQKFLDYMKALMNDSNHDRVFMDVFGVEFDECLKDFRESAGR